MLLKTRTLHQAASLGHFYTKALYVNTILYYGSTCGGKICHFFPFCLLPRQSSSRLNKRVISSSGQANDFGKGMKLCDPKYEPGGFPLNTHSGVETRCGQSSEASQRCLESLDASFPIYLTHRSRANRSDDFPPQRVPELQQFGITGQTSCCRGIRVEDPCLERREPRSLRCYCRCQAGWHFLTSRHATHMNSMPLC